MLYETPLQSGEVSTFPPAPRLTLADTCIGESPLLIEEERQALRQTQASLRPVRPGFDLVREGQRTDCLYFVIEGWACRYVTTHDGRRMILSLSIPGNLVNIDNLAGNAPNYGIYPLTCVVVLAIPRKCVSALVAKHAGIARVFLHLALADSAILNQSVFRNGRLTSKERLAHLLCELAIRLGSERSNSASFALGMTQEHLADALGMTPVHLNRTIQQLRAEELVITENRNITIPDIARLRIVAEFDPAYLCAGFPEISS